MRLIGPVRIRNLSALRVSALYLVLTMFGIEPVAAAPITFSTSSSNWDLIGSGGIDDLSLTVSGLPTNASSDLSVTFRLRADVNDGTEVAVMSIDGFSFGIWFDQNDTNDSIAGPAGDVGDQVVTIFTGTATIPLATFLPLLADGSLTALFDFSTNVSNIVGLGGTEFAEFSGSYDTAPVPEPGTIVLLGFGAGVACLRRRDRKQ
jgi:hypothetical protein